MPPIFSLPPRHPCAVAVLRRRGRVGLEAELLGGFGDAVEEEVLVLVVAVLAHDGAELRQLAVQDARDWVALAGDDLVQPVGEERDVGRERERRARIVGARVHRREVEDVRGRHQDLGQERVHRDPENQGEAAEPDPLALRPRERRNRAGQQQGERAIPRVVGQRIVQKRVVPQVVGDHPRPHHVHPDEAAHRYRHARVAGHSTVRGHSLTLDREGSPASSRLLRQAALLERVNQIAHKLRRRRTALLSHLSKLGTTRTVKTEGERLSTNTNANRASDHRRTKMLPVVRHTVVGLVPPTLQILISEGRTIS